jgi:adenylate kinase family enzyme
LLYEPRFGIGEADIEGEASPEDVEKAKRGWYPPNAFHTFWTLEVLKRFESKFPGPYLEASTRLDIPKVIDGMLLWSRKTLSYQVALHAAESSLLDSDQLAWSLASLLKFAPTSNDRRRLTKAGGVFPVDLGEQDLLREALKRLFKTQLSIGTWRHYRSLFHYQAAGNAYCYIYETFAVLLGIGLDGGANRQLFRDTLRDYADNLTRLWRYAESTRVVLGARETDQRPAIGWCSGHRLNQTEPESWATASVFAFCQTFRRLLGVWTREAARRELNHLKPTFGEPVEDVLRKRGATWRDGSTLGVTEKLYTMFINPVLMRGEGEVLEPDTEPIDKHQARSAILFGPPGTSKTTLSKAVAKSIGWDYIELHASHFVSDGLQNVQRKADEIFKRLMELDRTVVLFDEIDELVREREDEHDAFGRFLTTSMLPKLAELWEQRKLIYFVATNHIKYFDRAITRSQRFDALVLVSPPSYARKIAELKALVPSRKFSNLEKRMWEALLRAGKVLDHDTNRDAPLDSCDVLAKFVLLRWDQLEELSFQLRATGQDEIDEPAMTQGLSKIADQKLLLKAPYVEFVEDLKYPRRDFDKELVWRAEGFDREHPPYVKAGGRLYWLVVRDAELPPKTVAGLDLQKHDVTSVRFGQGAGPRRAGRRKRRASK